MNCITRKLYSSTVRKHCLHQCSRISRRCDAIHHSMKRNDKKEASPTTEKEQDSIDFGFLDIPRAEKQSRVNAVFAKTAQTYDAMNDYMSVGIHRVWKDAFIRNLWPSPDTKLLDVAGGTGDIAFRAARAMHEHPSQVPFLHDSTRAPGITVCDINENMLEVGKRRYEDAQIEANTGVRIDWVQGNAESLPFEDNTFDAYTIAFGIRNVPDINAALREAHRVLKRGGRFMCLEFSSIESNEELPLGVSTLIQSAYDVYSFECIPVIGHLVANDFESYQYLVESIRRFPTQLEFEAMITEAGFKLVKHENMSLGVVAIHSAFKI